MEIERISGKAQGRGVPMAAQKSPKKLFNSNLCNLTAVGMGMA
jgi:hypothetical protein